MENKYREMYYPNKTTMEERLFVAGQRCTATPIKIWLKTLLIGLLVALFGLAIASAGDFGIFLFVVGDLVFLIGLIGICVFMQGLRYLERAELLYNTRRASKDRDEKPAPKHATKQRVTRKEDVSDDDFETRINKQLEENKSRSNEEFVDHILKMSTDDLMLILLDQRDLYTEEELEIIEEVIAKRSK